MDAKEYEELFKLRLEADAERRLCQKALEEAEENQRLYLKLQAEQQTTEPLEVIPAPNYGKEMVERVDGVCDQLVTQHSEDNERYRADKADAEKQRIRNLFLDFIVGVLLIVCTLLIEHIPDIIEHIKMLLHSFF